MPCPVHLLSTTSADARTYPSDPCPSPPWLSAHSTTASTLPAPKMGTWETNALPALSWTLFHLCLPRSWRRSAAAELLIRAILGQSNATRYLSSALMHPPLDGWPGLAEPQLHRHTLTPSQKGQNPSPCCTPKMSSRHDSLSAVENSVRMTIFHPASSEKGSSAMSVPHILSGQSQAGAELTLDTFLRHREVLLSPLWWFPSLELQQRHLCLLLLPKLFTGTGERQVTSKSGWWMLFLGQPGSHCPKWCLCLKKT